METRTFKRRTVAALAEHRRQLYDIVMQSQPVTVKQVHDRAVELQLVEQNRVAYKATSRVLVDMRRKGDIPYEWIIDNRQLNHVAR